MFFGGARKKSYCIKRRIPKKGTIDDNDEDNDNDDDDDDDLHKIVKKFKIPREYNNIIVNNDINEIIKKICS